MLNGLEWIVKRKRELLHEDIQSVLKFGVVTNLFVNGITVANDFILIKDF